MSFSDYLVDKLGEDYLEANDHRIYFCPFCHETPDRKLYVNTSGGEHDGLWDCKRCSRVGNPVGFVMEFEGVGFGQAKDILEMYGFEDNEFFSQAKAEGLSDEEALYLMLLSGNKVEEKQEVRKTPPPLPEGLKLMMDNLDKKEVVPFLDYLVNKRNIEPRMVSKHNIGYVKEGSFTTSSGKKVSLYDHLVFFTYDNEGKYKYWNTRSIRNNPYLKTINASGSDEEFGRADSLFNFNTARLQSNIVLTEGVFDALTVGDEGVSGFGKQYTTNQVATILEGIEPIQKVYILLDRDAIMVKNARGESTTIKLAEQLYSEHEETYIVIPETNEDPNDLGHDKVWDLIENNAVKGSPEGRLLVSMM